MWIAHQHCSQAIQKANAMAFQYRESLHTLPNETLYQIVEHVGEQKGIARRYRVCSVLARVNRRLRSFAIHLLLSELWIPCTSNLYDKSYILHNKTYIHAARYVDLVLSLRSNSHPSHTGRSGLGIVSTPCLMLMSLRMTIMTSYGWNALPLFLIYDCSSAWILRRV